MGFQNGELVTVKSPIDMHTHLREPGDAKHIHQRMETEVA